MQVIQPIGLAMVAFVLGILSRYIADRMVDNKETTALREGLLLEILFMHQESRLYLLDRYCMEYKKNDFGTGDMFDLWRPKYSTKFYDTHVAKVDRPFGSDTCLQIHYYYWLVALLNQDSSDDNMKVSKDTARTYLKRSAEAYRMGQGATGALLGISEAKESLLANMDRLVSTFKNKSSQDRIAGIVGNYLSK
jgi:hypothetical protein